MSKDLKDIIRQEYIKCANSPSHFMRKYCSIQHPKRGRILFNLYPFQEKILELWPHHPYSIILKSRQLGCTTLAGAYALWLMLFHRDKNILCIATKEETAKNMVTKVRFMYENLPSWLVVDFEEKNKLTLRLKNGSQIKATSASSDAGRSEAVSLLIIDEAAFIDNIGEIWASAQQTLACIEENSIVYTDSGLVRIKDILQNPKEGFNDININILDRNNQSQNSTHFYKSPPSPTLKITFDDGNSIITTKEHPLLNNKEEWVKSKDLSIGDKIKSYYNQNVFGSEIQYPKYNNEHFNSKGWSLNNIDLAYLSGLWVAEGNYNKRGISISCGDEPLQKWLESIGFVHQGRVSYRLSSIIAYKIFKEFLQLTPLAKNKRVPSKILNSSKREYIAFLQGCFDGDGCSHSKGISYSSTSEQLVKDLQIMLLNLGIRSKIYKVFWKKNHLVKADSYGFRLDINKENSLKYYDIVGFRLERKNSNIDKIKNVKDWGGVELNINVDLIKNLIKQSNFSLSEWNRKFTNIEGYLWRGNANLSKQAILDILDNCDSSLNEYKILYNEYHSRDNLYYSTIVNIEENRVIETYDLKVPHNESFIANNLVNHNTGGGAIVLSTPYGTGNWFHKMYTAAENKENSFLPIRLPWFVHPERDQAWRDKQDELLGDPKMAAQECFSGDTIIYTLYGPKFIKDINIGDQVLSHDGTYNKVINTFSKIDNESVGIKGGINNIRKYTTLNHPFYNEYKEFEEVKSIINSGNMVNLFPNVNYPISSKSIDLSLYITSNSPKLFPLKVNKEYIWLTKTSKVNRKIKFDYDLGFLVGCFLSEGSLAKNKVEFSFNGKTEREGFPLEIERILQEKFNIDRFSYYTSKMWEGSSKLYIKDQIFNSFIKLCIQGGELCHEKSLSEFFYQNSNIDTLRGVLDGVLVGDGMLKEEYNISLLLTSQKLIYDILYISNLLGIHNVTIKQGLSQNPHTPSSRPNYTLTWGNSKIKSNSKIFTERIKNWDRKNTLGKSNKNINFKYTDLPYGRIKIEDTLSPQVVYNIEVENTHTYVTEYGVVHNCDCDFTTSGDTVFLSEWLSFIEETTIQEPVERRGVDQNLWIWEYPDYSRDYMIVCDVARGDGKDFSTAHVIDIVTNTQVAEFKSQLPPKEFGYFLVGLATEYNDGILVIENANIGWSAIDAVIEKGYKNLYYSPKSDQITAESYSRSFENQNDMVPGFTMSLRTRPLVINKFREFVGERSVTIRSKRLLEEMKVFVWKNGRPEAQSGYNDDLVMSFGVGMYLRDTSLRFQQENLDRTRAALGGISTNKTSMSGVYTTTGTENPYKVRLGSQVENISWLLN